MNASAGDVPSNQDPFWSYFAHERKSSLKDIYPFREPQKTYRRAKKVSLLKEGSLIGDLAQALSARESTRVFDTTNKLSLQEISILLRSSFGFKNSSQEKRTFPSGGGKYPIELYLLSLNSEIAQGVYHYDVSADVLSRLPILNVRNVYSQLITANKVIENPQICILLSFIKSRSVHKYATMAYKLALLEAGHIGQNVYLTSAATNIGCCALGLGDVRHINKSLNLDGVNESVIYGLVLGKKT